MVTFNSVAYTDTICYETVDPETGMPRYYYEDKEVILGLKEYMKEELPTMRFWLMLKLQNEERWTNRWERYLDDLRARLRAQFSGNEEDVVFQIRRQIEKAERSAWNTMPAAFLQNVLRVPRALRR